MLTCMANDQQIKVSTKTWQDLSGLKQPGDSFNDVIRRLFGHIADANDDLAESMRSAQTYASHEQVRPSAIRALDAAENAHQLLTDVDITRHREVGSDE